MSNKIEPKFSSFSAAKDDVVTIQNIGAAASPVSKNAPEVKQETPSPAPRSTFSILATLTLYIAVGCSVWWFYQENIRLQQLLSTSDLRITQLEQQLSATGEELGESAGDMKFT